MANKNKDIKAPLNYISFGNLVVGIIIGTLVVNKFGINFINNWRLEYNSVLIEYLKVILSMPSVILVVLVVFFSKFRSAIDYFIRNMRINYKGLEATSQQAKDAFPDGTQVSEESEEEVIKLSKQDAQSIASSIDTLTGENNSKQKQIEDLIGLVQELANRSELFEFKYLNNVLVLTTKLVLRDLSQRGSMTKEDLIRSIIVPPTVADKFSEQIAVYSALLVNGLISENGSLLMVNEKGMRYLKFNGLVQ